MIVKQRMARRTIHYWNHTPQTNRIGHMATEYSHPFKSMHSPPLSLLQLQTWRYWYELRGASGLSGLEVLTVRRGFGCNIFWHWPILGMTYLLGESPRQTPICDIKKNTCVLLHTNEIIKEKPRSKIMWDCISHARVQLGEIAMSMENAFRGRWAYHGRLGVEGILGRREWPRDRRMCW